MMRLVDSTLFEDTISTTRPLGGTTVDHPHRLPAILDTAIAALSRDCTSVVERAHFTPMQGHARSSLYLVVQAALHVNDSFVAPLDWPLARNRHCMASHPRTAEH